MTIEVEVDRGSSTVEAVLMAPLLVLLVLFGIFVGRTSEATTEVKHAADQGARAAAMASVERMSDVAREAALSDLEDRGVSCPSPEISVTPSPGDHTVAVTVSCSVSVEGLSLLGVDGPRLSATSVEVIDRYRGGD